MTMNGSGDWIGLRGHDDFAHDWVHGGGWHIYIYIYVFIFYFFIHIHRYITMYVYIYTVYDCYTDTYLHGSLLMCLFKAVRCGDSLAALSSACFIHGARRRGNAMW